MSIPARQPLRGEIWFVSFPLDPQGTGLRPVVVVSANARNSHERADSVLVVPLTTAVHRDVRTRLILPAGETGLQSDSAAKAEDIVAVLKQSLIAPRVGLRMISDSKVCEIAKLVSVAMGCGRG